MEELHILLTPNKEHNKVLSDVPVVGFRNGKSLRDYLVRAKLSKLEESGRCEPCGEKAWLDCTTATFSTEACQEAFKIQKDLLNCDSEKVSGEVPYVGKTKTIFCYKFKNYKSKYRAFRKGNQKVPQKRFHAHSLS